MKTATYNLVEKTEGPWKGSVWRSEEMTDTEAAERNAKIGVMQWEKSFAQEVEQLFSVEKVSEGGIGQREAIRMLKEAGIKAKAAHSPYVGQSGVMVTGTPAQINEAEELLF